MEFLKSRFELATYSKPVNQVIIPEACKEQFVFNRTNATIVDWVDSFPRAFWEAMCPERAKERCLPRPIYFWRATYLRLAMFVFE